MALVLSEAKALLAPQLTISQAHNWAYENDKFLFIEYEIFPMADIQSSTNSTFGQVLAEWVEDQFETILAKGYAT